MFATKGANLLHHWKSLRRFLNVNFQLFGNSNISKLDAPEFGACRLFVKVRAEQDKNVFELGLYQEIANKKLVAHAQTKFVVWDVIMHLSVIPEKELVIG